MQLEGKIAIVTGSGQGIGRATAIAFAREGALVVIATRTEAHGAETLATIEAAGGRAMLHVVDLADHAAARAMVDAAAAVCGGLDILVHNAAAFGSKRLMEMDEETLDRLFNLNVKACFTLTQAAVPHMRKRGGGRIIVTSSVTGPKVTMPGSGAYATSKAAVTGFINTAALELAEYGITVNGIEPGYIDTPALTRLKARYGEANISKYIPAKRLGRPDEIAGPMVFLASEAASYVTGETIVVDGGARLPESPVWAD